MEFIDYEDMPDKNLRTWLGHIRDEIKKDMMGFPNVRALKLGAIETALKRLDELRKIEAAGDK